jgi:hypothetical protein
MDTVQRADEKLERGGGLDLEDDWERCVQGAEAEIDTTLGVGLKLITTSSSSTSRRITPSSCRDKLKPVLHELLKGTPLDEYSNVYEKNKKLECQQEKVQTS